MSAPLALVCCPLGQSVGLRTWLLELVLVGGGRWKGEHTRASRTAGREELWAGLLVAAGAVRKKAMLCWEDGLSPQPAEPLACPLAPRGPVGLVPSGVQKSRRGPGCC